MTGPAATARRAHRWRTLAEAAAARHAGTTVSCDRAAVDLLIGPLSNSQLNAAVTVLYTAPALLHPTAHGIHIQPAPPGPAA